MTIKIISLAAFLALASAPIGQAHAAVTVPSFPSCVNPQGALKVSYDSGSHGIIGMDGLRTGSDKVFKVSDYDQLLQCFCPENGNGIQTNWWEASKLSVDDIEYLKKEGWHYAPDGSEWGLSDRPYVAKNFDYNCKPSDNNPTPTPTPQTSVAGVLSLASTGNITFIYTLMLTGFVSLITGLFLRFKK